MGDGHGFSEDFLRRLESTFGDDLLEELLALTSAERSALAEVLLERKKRRAGKDGV